MGIISAFGTAETLFVVPRASRVTATVWVAGCVLHSRELWSNMEGFRVSFWGAVGGCGFAESGAVEGKNAAVSQWLVETSFCHAVFFRVGCMMQTQRLLCGLEGVNVFPVDVCTADDVTCITSRWCDKARGKSVSIAASHVYHTIPVYFNTGIPCAKPPSLNQHQITSPSSPPPHTHYTQPLPSPHQPPTPSSKPPDSTQISPHALPPSYPLPPSSLTHPHTTSCSHSP
jgi:hypothetical protein